MPDAVSVLKRLYAIAFIEYRTSALTVGVSKLIGDQELTCISLDL